MAIESPRMAAMRARSALSQVCSSLRSGVAGELECAGRRVRGPVVRRARTSGSPTLVPVGVDLAAGRFDLRDLTGATYREPFFHETIERAKFEQRGSLVVGIDFETFVRIAERYPGRPDAFIFHVGRCGSTLLANMLSASEQHLIIKEPDVVSDLIAGWLNTSDHAVRQEIERLLQAAVRYLLGAAGSQRYRGLKLAAWNLQFGATLLDLFPATPALFVYRSPLETVASLFFQRPAWFDLIQRPRSIQARFFPTVRGVPEEVPLSPTTLFAHAWRSAAEAALALPSKRLLMIGYRALVTKPEDVIRQVLSHFGQPADSALIARMVAASAIYAKDPAGRAPFDPKGEHHRPTLSLEHAEEVQAITSDLWVRLEARTNLTPQTGC